MMLLAQAYAQMAAPAGIRVNVITSPAEGYWDTIWLKKAGRHLLHQRPSTGGSAHAVAQQQVRME